jgi:Asp-tRNA(Asn)/Glu-tRNA(Gln) amidotransferase A subunit family amidase
MIWALALPIAFGYIIYSIFFKREQVCQRGGQPARIVAPIRQVLENSDKTTYNVRNFSAPKVTGWLFQLLIRLSYTLFGRNIIVKPVMKKSNMDIMQGVFLPEKPSFLGPAPTPPLTKDHSQPNKELLQKLLEKEVDGEKGGFRLPTVADFVGAFRSGRCSPTEVAEAVLNAIEDSNKASPPLRAIIETSRDVVLAQANASTQRWKEGKTLSLLDGVPVAIKGEYRVEPYDFYGGASFVPQLGHGVPEAALVQKLASSGAVIIGVANLQEFGAGTIGSNPNKNHLTARNPYNPQCYPGGSSSGSAVCVAAGLCPVAVGADGGGSIRIPAGLCGVVGLKPTNGFLDHTGMFSQTHTVGTAGPLCSSVLDAAITMDIFSKEIDGAKKLISLQDLSETSLEGLKVGIYWKYFEDADSEVVQKCKAAVSRLKSLGAEIVNIKIPELEQSRIAHAVTIISEFANALGLDIDRHFDEFTLESLLLIGVGFHFTAVEYLNAQKQRTRAIEAMKYVFNELNCDVIITPATALPAPKIPPEAVSMGISDAETSTALMRFSFLGNLTGVPGLVLPVGYTSGGLPVGLQVMGQWYKEGVLLKIGYALEKTGAFPTKKPQVFYDLIKMASSD